MSGLYGEGKLGGAALLVVGNKLQRKGEGG